MMRRAKTLRNWTQRCVYCGRESGLHATCRGHRDLLKLDPRYNVHT